MLTFAGSIALFAIGFIVVIVLMLVVGSRAMSKSKEKGVVISDGISRDEFFIVLDEIVSVIRSYEIDIKEVLEVVKMLAVAKESHLKKAKAQVAVEIAEKVKEGANKVIKEAQPELQPEQ